MGILIALIISDISGTVKMNIETIGLVTALSIALFSIVYSMYDLMQDSR